MQKRPSFWYALGVTILITAGIVWGVNSFTNGDLLWFLPVFNARADWIAIYWDSESTMLFPGDPGYDLVMDAFADAVTHPSGYEGKTAISESTLEILRQDWRLVEFHYNDPIQVHTPHLFPKARVFFVPITGAHSEWRRIFGALTDIPTRAGALTCRSERFEVLQSAVAQAVGREP